MIVPPRADGQVHDFAVREVARSASRHLRAVHQQSVGIAVPGVLPRSSDSASAMRAIPVTSSPSAGSGTDVLEQQRLSLTAEWRTAGPHNAFASSGRRWSKTRPRTVFTTALSLAHLVAAWPRSSEPATSMAAASRSRSIRKVSSTALIATESTTQHRGGEVGWHSAFIDRRLHRAEQ